MLKNTMVKQPTEEDPDEGIKDLVEMMFKRMVRTRHGINTLVMSHDGMVVMASNTLVMSHDGMVVMASNTLVMSHDGMVVI